MNTKALLLVAFTAGAGSVAAEPCDRSCLRALVDDYRKALVAHDPSGLPLARAVKFTENTATIPVGDGLWVNASEPSTTFSVWRFGERTAPAGDGADRRARLPVGDGLWNTMSARGGYKLYVADPEGGQVGFFGTIRENRTPAILALRLGILDGEIAEVETLVARSEEGALNLEFSPATTPRGRCPWARRSPGATGARGR